MDPELDCKPPGKAAKEILRSKQIASTRSHTASDRWLLSAPVNNLAASFPQSARVPKQGDPSDTSHRDSVRTTPRLSSNQASRRFEQNKAQFHRSTLHKSNNVLFGAPQNHIVSPDVKNTELSSHADENVFRPTKLPHIVRQTAVQQHHVQQQICRAQLYTRNRLRTAPVLKRPQAYQYEVQDKEQNRVYLPSVAKAWTARPQEGITNETKVLSEVSVPKVESEKEARVYSGPNPMPMYTSSAEPNLHSRHLSTTCSVNSIHTPSIPVHDALVLDKNPAPLSIEVFHPRSKIYDRKSRTSSVEDRPESALTYERVAFHPPRLNTPRQPDYLIFQQHFSSIAAETRKKNSGEGSSRAVQQPQEPIIHTNLKPLDEREEARRLDRPRVLPDVRSRLRQHSASETIVGNGLG
ncbi:hypothetical protein BJ742DRAFT_854220 [Cladochytrium replicatum]|nr:hypothetical protein BJ742DRAFT_854220 [Cladochytrium replicatum]